MQNKAWQTLRTCHVFVSHSSKDANWCRSFVESFTSLGFTVEYDENYIKIGQIWLNRIEERIQSADIFVVILSPDSNESYWVQQEIYLAMQNRKYIVSVMHRNAEVNGFLNNYQIYKVIGQSGQEAAQSVAHAIQEVDIDTPPETKTISTTLCKIVYGRLIGENNCFYAVDDTGHYILHSRLTFRGKPGRSYGEYISETRAYDELYRKLLRRGWHPIPGSSNEPWYQSRFEQKR